MSSRMDTYYFVDGSSLIADINALWRSNPTLKKKKLSIVEFARYFTGERFYPLIGEGYKRFVVYFVKNDDRISSFFVLPNRTDPAEMPDVQIKYCGKRVHGSKAAYKWIEKKKPPKSVLEILKKSEKAVDTQICCDALSLSCHRNLSRLFLYTNDYDYLPLCEALKNNGSNISLFRLAKKSVNKSLVENCDSFSVVSSKELEPLFF